MRGALHSILATGSSYEQGQPYQTHLSLAASPFQAACRLCRPQARLAGFGVEAAIASFLSPDGSERMEAAFSRRLDRITRQVGKLDYHIEVGNEAFALYLRRWLAVTPAIPAEANAAARADAEKRFDFFVEALARRMETGRHLADDLIRAAPEPELGEIENTDGNGPESPTQP